MSMNILIVRDDVGVKMYDGPIPTPCVIYRRVMDQATNEGDEYIFNEDPEYPGTGIMTLEGNTVAFLHKQEQLPDGRTKKYPVWTVNGKVVDTFKNPQVEFVGKTTVTYKPNKEDVVMTVIVEEPKKVNEEKAMEEEEAMSEQEDKKEKEEEEEAMSDEEDNKEKEEEPVKKRHFHMDFSDQKAAAALAAVEADKKATELKAAQDRADRIAYDALSLEFKIAFATFKEQEENLKQARYETFKKMLSLVDPVPRSVIPAPANVTKDVSRMKVRALDVFRANPENATIMAKILRLTAWVVDIENDGEKNTNDKSEKYFNMWIHNNPEEGAKAQEALRVHLENAKKRKQRPAEEDAGSSSRGSKAPRCSISRTITAGLKVKSIVKKLEGAKSNK